MFEHERITKPYFVEVGKDALPREVADLAHAHGLRRIAFDPTIGDEGKYVVQIQAGAGLPARDEPVKNSNSEFLEKEAGDLRFLQGTITSAQLEEFCRALGDLY